MNYFDQQNQINEYIISAPQRIWTHDGIVDWIYIKDDRFIQIGRDPYPSIDGVCLIELPQEQFIIPGLIDSHIHVQLLGESLMKFGVDLRNAQSLQHIDLMLTEYSEQTADIKILVGNGWSEDQLKHGLARRDLDHLKVSQKYPVILFRNCLHKCVINTKMLNLIGLVQLENQDDQSEFETIYLEDTRQFFAKEAQNQKSFIVERDETGDYTGIICESGLFELKKLIYLHYSFTVKQQIFLKGAYQCLSYGLTAVQTNDFYQAFEIWKSLVDTKNFKLKVFMTVPFDEISQNSKFHVSGIKPGINYLNLSCDRVKLFADGSLGAKTAALKQCYKKCNHKGYLLESKESFAQKVANAQNLGWRLEVHAIGDEAAEVVLDAFERANIQEQDRALLTHCQILSEQSIKRMQRMGVIANIQPSFVTSDAPSIESILDQNSEQFKYSYIWKTLLDSNIRCAGGSDAPVETCNPLHGMHAAITRQFKNQDGSKQVFKPNECLTFDQAMNLYTVDGAFACKKENQIGKIKEQFRADFVVLDKKIWDPKNDYHNLLDAKVVQVFIDGQKIQLNEQ